MSRRSGAAAGLAAMIAAWPSQATAQQYDVAPGCPTRQAWNEGLQARLPEPLRAVALQRFNVSVQREPASGTDSIRYTGQLVPAGAPVSEARSVNGASCQEVVEALTLIAALALRQQPTPGMPSSSLPDLELSAPQLRAPTEDAPLDASAARDPERLRVGLAGFVLLQSVTAPRLAADPGVGVTLSWQTEHFQPWLLFGVYWGGEQARVQDGSATARFDRWSTHVVGCPLRFPRQSPWGLRPCLNLDLGRVHGTGVHVNEASQSAALLASSGLELRLEWSVLEQLELGVEFGGVVSLARPRFFFAPDYTALQVPALGVRSGAAASLSF